MLKPQSLKLAGADDTPDPRSPIVVWGLPTSAGGGTGRLGAENGPDELRRASHGWNSLRTSSGYPFGGGGAISDLGNLNLDGLAGLPLMERIERHCPVAGWERFLLSLGGDHSISYAVVKALAQSSGQAPGLIYFDAHPDTVDMVDGNRYSHAAVLRRLVDEGWVDPARTLLIGIRVPEAEEVVYLASRQLAVITPFDILEKGFGHVWSAIQQRINGAPLYLSLDLDVIDAGEVPGVETPEPAGLSSRELLYLVDKLAPHLWGADIVELSAECDPAGITAKTAARLAIDIVGGKLQGLGGG